MISKLNMLKTSTLLLLLTISLNGYCQKPQLPSDYFEKFTYSFSKGLNYHDSASFATEIHALAGNLYESAKKGLQEYEIKDTTQLADVYSYVQSAALSLHKFKEAQEASRMYNMLKPPPDYSPPFGLFSSAYIQAVMITPDKDPQLFSNAFRKALHQNLGALHKDFRNDIVNSSKGRYNGQTAEVYEKQIQRTLEQSLTQSQGTISYSNAITLLNLYFGYNLWKRYWKTAEDVFYEISPSKVEQQTVKIPVRDGIKLHGLLFRDVASAEKVPAIVSLSPYPSAQEATYGNVFATNGYVYIYVDSRGRGNSEGEFFPYEKDAQDFYDIIDWVSKQSWCNGQVATSGGSYLGFAQWQAVRKAYKHPALKAINPMVSVGFGIDFPRMYNTFYSYILQWACFVSGKEINSALFYDQKFWDAKTYELYKKRIPFASLDSVAGMPNPYFKKWVSHPDLDGYWKSILPSPEDYAQIDIPILSITGYYDADQLGAFHYYNSHQQYGNEAAKSKHYMLIGPYDHGGAQWQPRPTQAGIAIEKEAQIPIYKYVIRWFDWVLKGKQKPAFIQDKINYFATGTGKWAATPSFKASTKGTLSFYLSPVTVKNNKRNNLYLLDTKAPGTESTLTYQHDIASVLDSTFVFNAFNPDDSLYITSPYNMVFETPPLEKDIIITDKITPRLYLGLNVPDADFVVQVFEITPDGKSSRLCISNIRARYRNGGENPQLMKPGAVELFNFTENLIYIKKLRQGSKLRMTFESINTPHFEKNFGFGGVVSKETTNKPRVIKATLNISKAYPSRIDIPYATE
jgi:putative CocE/NonD family hydrolase